MRFPCWIPKATDRQTDRQTHTHTHTEYVILKTFPRQKWLCERVSVLRYTYVAYLKPQHTGAAFGGLHVEKVTCLQDNRHRNTGGGGNTYFNVNSCRPDRLQQNPPHLKAPSLEEPHSLKRKRTPAVLRILTCFV